ACHRATGRFWVLGARRVVSRGRLKCRCAERERHGSKAYCGFGVHTGTPLCRDCPPCERANGHQSADWGCPLTARTARMFPAIRSKRVKNWKGVQCSYAGGCRRFAVLCSKAGEKSTWVQDAKCQSVGP